VPTNRVTEALTDVIDEPLELRVLERVHLPAAVADRVVVVLAARVGGLVASGSVEVDPVDELQARERVQRTVDARKPHGLAAVAEAVVDVLGAQAAVLPREQCQHLFARAAGPVPGAGQLAMRVIPPLGAGDSHAPDGSARR
jgi:hypothetical protein